MVLRIMAKLLIVDDEENIREVVREYAEFSGFDVEEAGDGREAVSLCRINDYDLIIMDIMMPKLDGFSACKEIKKEKDVPVIMMSARGEEYDKLFGFELGIDDYVTKPFSPKELMARVNKVLSGAALYNGTGTINVSDVFVLFGFAALVYFVINYTLSCVVRSMQKRRKKPVRVVAE